MRQDFFEFANHATIWQATNHKPHVQGTDKAIWDRLKLVPLTEWIPPNERDERLMEKLEQPGQRDAVLAWMVEGLRIARDEGLEPPDEVREATATYEDEMSPLREWESEYVLDPDVTTPVAWVWRSYIGTCEAANVPPHERLNQRQFNAALEGLGLTRAPEKRNRKVVKVWKGIRLVAEGWTHELGRSFFG